MRRRRGVGRRRRPRVREWLGAAFVAWFVGCSVAPEYPEGALPAPPDDWQGFAQVPAHTGGGETTVMEVERVEVLYEVESGMYAADPDAPETGRALARAAPFDPCAELEDDASTSNVQCNLPEETSVASAQTNISLRDVRFAVGVLAGWTAPGEVPPNVQTRSESWRRYSFAYRIQGSAEIIAYDRGLFSTQLQRCGAPCADDVQAIEFGNAAHELGHWAEGHPERGGMALRTFCEAYGAEIVPEVDGAPSTAQWRELWADFYAGRALRAADGATPLATFFHELERPGQNDDDHPDASLRESAIAAGARIGLQERRRYNAVHSDHPLTVAPMAGLDTFEGAHP